MIQLGYKHIEDAEDIRRYCREIFSPFWQTSLTIPKLFQRVEEANPDKKTMQDRTVVTWGDERVWSLSHFGTTGGTAMLRMSKFLKIPLLI